MNIQEPDWPYPIYANPTAFEKGGETMITKHCAEGEHHEFVSNVCECEHHKRTPADPPISKNQSRYTSTLLPNDSPGPSKSCRSILSDYLFSLVHTTGECFL